MVASEGRKPPKDQDLWHLLDNAVALIVGQDQVLWSIFGVYSATVSILLVALFTSGTFPERRVGLIISLFGLVMSVAWFFIQRRAIGYMYMYGEAIGKIHDELMRDTDSTYWIWNRTDRSTYLRWPRARHTMKVTVGFVTIAWIILLGYFVFQ